VIQNRNIEYAKTVNAACQALIVNKHVF